MSARCCNHNCDQGRTCPLRTLQPCFGKLCPQHAECARWHAVPVQGSRKAIGNCLDGREWPLFVPHAGSQK